MVSNVKCQRVSVAFINSYGATNRKMTSAATYRSSTVCISLDERPTETV